MSSIAIGCGVGETFDNNALLGGGGGPLSGDLLLEVAAGSLALEVAAGNLLLEG